MASAEREFAQRARLARRAQGLSQREVSERMSKLGFPYHQVTISRMENGEQGMGLDELLAMSAVLGIPVDGLCQSMHRKSFDDAVYRAIAAERDEAFRLRDEAIAERRQAEAELAKLRRLVARGVAALERLGLTEVRDG